MCQNLVKLLTEPKLHIYAWNILPPMPSSDGCWYCFYRLGRERQTGSVTGGLGTPVHAPVG